MIAPGLLRGVMRHARLGTTTGLSDAVESVLFLDVTMENGDVAGVAFKEPDITAFAADDLPGVRALEGAECWMRRDGAASYRFVRMRTPDDITKGA
jgi:hypothetical protein